MSDVVKEITIGNKVLRIECDMDNESPREWDNVGVMATWHRRDHYGDIQPKVSPEEFMQDLAFEVNGDLYDVRDSDLDALPGLVAQELEKSYVIVKVFMFDHGGVTLRTTPFGDPWDSGQLGIIYCTMERARSEWGGGDNGKDDAEVRRLAEACLAGEVETYSQWLEGDIYWFQIVELITCKHCGHVEGEQKDSCGGFYGTDWKTNGICDHLPKEFAEALENE